jgi:hypothetical protein
MDFPRRSFVNNISLIRTRSALGYAYTWRFEDQFGQIVEMEMEEFSHYISDNLAKLKVSRLTR